MQPLPGRECGGCTACCVIPAIDSPELQKPPGVPCVHCELTQGCRIYAERPAPCRTFECGWRVLPFIPDDLRPDLSGILTIPDDDAPSGYADTSAIKFIVTGDETALTQINFLECVAGLIYARVPTYLATPLAPTHALAETLLNEKLAEAVETRNAKAMTEILLRVMAALKSAPRA